MTRPYASWRWTIRGSNGCFVAWCRPTDYLEARPGPPKRRTLSTRILTVKRNGTGWLFGRNAACTKCWTVIDFPLTVYDGQRLVEWLDRWPLLVRSEQTLQALNSPPCAHYALWFLKDHTRGQSMLEFVQGCSPYDLVSNVRQIGQEVCHWIVGRIARIRRSP